MKYSLTRIVAPTDEIVTLEEAYDQLRLDTFTSPATNPEDDLITALIEGIVQELDAGTGWLGRALAAQTWRLSLEDFPCDDDPIRLPYPPFIEVTSFTYTDTDGNLQTLTLGTDFRVLPHGDDGAKLRPLYLEKWPTNARCDNDSVQIEFRCGYVTGSPETMNVPDVIKNWIKATLTGRYDSRGVDARGVTSVTTAAVENSLNNLRVWSYNP